MELAKSEFEHPVFLRIGKTDFSIATGHSLIDVLDEQISCRTLFELELNFF